MTEKITYGPKCLGCVFFCSDSIKFKDTEDVIPTKESAEEVIPDREENHAGATEENGPEEIAGPNQSRQPVHPHVANKVRIERIINDIKAPGPLTRSKASH